jgi:hypothetical protein
MKNCLPLRVKQRPLAPLPYKNFGAILSKFAVKGGPVTLLPKLI